jgi:hypothetical protein
MTRILAKLRNRMKLIKLLVALVALVVIGVLVGPWGALVFALFGLAFLLELDPLVAYSVALILIILCALMVVIEQNSTAQGLANWSYCFLAIGVSLQFYYYLKSPEEEGGDS